MKILISLTVGFIILVAGLAFTVLAHYDPVKICHATGAGTYQSIIVNHNAIDGHFYNNGTPKAGHEDDILYQNAITHCPSPTPSPRPSPSPEPSPEVSPSPEPSPEATTEAKTEQPSGNITTPQCPDKNTTNVVANLHVLRSGSDATVNFFITEGDRANIYYSIVGQPHWQYAVGNVKGNNDNYVSYTIHDLNPNLGYDFGVQQVFNCGGGLTTGVVVDGPTTQLFNLSYWE